MLIEFEAIMKDQSFKSFLQTSDEVFSFVHRTDSEKVCQRILNEGFLYAESFHKTTDRVIDDEIYLNYWNLQRKHYGEFIIKIDFSKSLINQLQVKFQSSLQSIDVQQILAESLGRNDEEENVFLLPLFYVKGYFDMQNKKEVFNPFYNPSFLPEHLKNSL